MNRPRLRTLRRHALATGGYFPPRREAERFYRESGYPRWTRHSGRIFKAQGKIHFTDRIGWWGGLALPAGWELDRDKGIFFRSVTS